MFGQRLWHGTVLLRRSAGPVLPLVDVVVSARRSAAVGHHPHHPVLSNARLGEADWKPAHRNNLSRLGNGGESRQRNIHTISS